MPEDINDKTPNSQLQAKGWLTGALQEHNALFSEMDVLLRALDKFFILENQPASKSSINSKNLFPELLAVRDVIIRIISILESVIPASNRNAYWFQRFAENRLVDGRTRDIYRKGMYRQETPEQSLYLLYDSFINLKSLCTDILKTRDISYMSFRNIGQIISKEIRENDFFNPFKQEINPLFDSITNKEIKDVVKKIENKEHRKVASILYLHLFRFLRYLATMDHKSLRHSSINVSMVVFALVKSEIEVFIAYINKTSDTVGDDELSMIMKGLSLQFSMEGKRIFMQELKDIFEKKTATQLRARVENSRGIMKNLTEQCIIQLAKRWHPNLKGEKIFEVFINKSAQSYKLREDMYVLQRLLYETERSADDQAKFEATLKVLLSYMDYFENFTFKLLRYDDYEEFSGLFNSIRLEVKKNDRPKLMDACHRFNIFVSTTIRQIQNRAELKGRPLDLDKVEEIVQQYLPLPPGLEPV